MLNDMIYQSNAILLAKLHIDFYKQVSYKITE